MSRSRDNIDNLKILKGSHLPVPSKGPSAALLEVFPNCYQHRFYVINIVFPEFTSLCPVTGQPDFGTISVDYIANKYCVESKSFKLYMFAYRQHHSFMETITNTILEDLITVMHPYWCRVQGLFVPRGGTRINVYAEQYEVEDSELEQKLRTRVNEYRLEMPLMHA